MTERYLKVLRDLLAIGAGALAAISQAQATAVLSLVDPPSISPSGPFALNLTWDTTFEGIGALQIVLLGTDQTGAAEAAGRSLIPTFTSDPATSTSTLVKITGIQLFNLPPSDSAPVGDVALGSLNFTYNNFADLTSDGSVRFDLLPKSPLAPGTALTFTAILVVDETAILSNTLPLTVQPIPEPATWVLLLSGLGFAGAVASRRLRA